MFLYTYVGLIPGVRRAKWEQFVALAWTGRGGGQTDGLLTKRQLNIKSQKPTTPKYRPATPNKRYQCFPREPPKSVREHFHKSLRENFAFARKYEKKRACSLQKCPRTVKKEPMNFY